MSRKLTITEDEISEVLALLANQLRNSKFQDGKIEFSKKLADHQQRAELWFTAKAILKTKMLVDDFTGEVQWHGIVNKVGDAKWIVEDILVFPHTVTSVTVTSDQDKYEEWLSSLPDDVFNHIRFHGHSHVNMGTTPSGVDNQVRDNILQQMSAEDDEPYYIFCIFNKAGVVNSIIYDVGGNMLYENKDIDVLYLIDDNTASSSFLEEAHKLAVPPAPVKTQTSVDTTKNKTQETQIGFYERNKNNNVKKQNKYPYYDDLDYGLFGKTDDEKKEENWWESYRNSLIGGR